MSWPRTGGALPFAAPAATWSGAAYLSEAGAAAAAAAPPFISR